MGGAALHGGGDYRERVGGIPSRGGEPTLSSVRSQIEALRVYSDEDIARKAGAFEGWVRIDDVLSAFPEGAGGPDA